jgi:hypothetical protein
MQTWLSGVQKRWRSRHAASRLEFPIPHTLPTPLQARVKGNFANRNTVFHVALLPQISPLSQRTITLKD